MVSHIQKKKKFKYLISIFIYYIFEFKYFNCILLKKKKKLLLKKNSQEEPLR